MEIKNILNSFFGNYEKTFYIENISTNEISISKDGKVLPDTAGILHDFLSEDDEKTILNTEKGFLFHISGDCYKIDFEDYITTNTALSPKATIAKKGTGFDIKLFIKHD